MKLENKLERLSKLPITDNEGEEIFLVEEIGKLNGDIMDTVIAIRSRKVGGPSDRYKLLLDALEELQGTTDMLQECQHKVIGLWSCKMLSCLEIYNMSVLFGHLRLII